MVVIDDEETFAADAPDLDGEEVTLRPRYVLQEGVGEDEVNALISQRETAAVSSHRLVRARDELFKEPERDAEFHLDTFFWLLYHSCGCDIIGNDIFALRRYR